MSFDWMLIAIGLLAAALVAGAVIRTETAGEPTRFGTFVGGLRSLGPSETLVVFEDGASGGGSEWSTGRRDHAHVGLGAVWLVEPGEQTLTRRIVFPEGTVQATLGLDLIAIDDWRLEGLELSINGRPVLRQSFSSRPDLIGMQETEVLDGDGITLHTRLNAPRELGFDGGDAASAETRLVVGMALDTPDRAIEIAIAPLPVPEGSLVEARAMAPIWAVDNLIVVAASLP